MAELDPITVDITRYKLDGIAGEMQSTLLRQFVLADRQGGSSMPRRASSRSMARPWRRAARSRSTSRPSPIPAVATIIETFPIAQMREGDIYILNDPYCGGTHLPDIAVVQPVIHRGRPIALAAAMTHHQDVGGMSAGSVPTNATEIYPGGPAHPAAEAARRPAPTTRRSVALIRQNVRIPDTVMGDLNAQIAACTIGARAASPNWPSASATTSSQRFAPSCWTAPSI